MCTEQAQYSFDLKWGFFAVMGGFEMAVPGEPQGLQPLSPKGVRKLAAIDIKPFAIPTSRIEDRSKADTLQKGLVLLQVGWMALQCITRKVYGLPITLLELHTMVHVVCAIIMYAFWFKVRQILPGTREADGLIIWAAETARSSQRRGARL